MANRALFSIEFDDGSHVADFFISLAGTGEGVKTKLFLGWFGPRGLASIVFTLIVLNENLVGGKMLGTIAVCTVGTVNLTLNQPDYTHERC